MASPQNLANVVIKILTDAGDALKGIQQLRKDLEALSKAFTKVSIAPGVDKQLKKLGTGLSDVAKTLGTVTTSATQASKAVSAMGPAAAGSVAKTKKEVITLTGEIDKAIARMQNFTAASADVQARGTARFRAIQAAMAANDEAAVLAEVRRPGSRRTLGDVFGPDHPTAGKRVNTDELGKQALAQMRESTNAAVEGMLLARQGALKFSDILNLAVGSATQNFDGLRKQVRTLGGEIDTTTNKTGKFATTLSGLLEVPTRGGLFERIFGNFTDSLETAIAIVARFTAARVIIDSATLAMREFTTAAIELEDALAQVRAITGENKDAIDVLGFAMRQFSEDSIISLSEASKGLQIFAQAGYNTSQSLQALPSLVALSVGGVTTLEEAAKLLTSTLQTFNISVAESDRVVNVLVATANKSKTSIEDLNVAFNYAGNTAAGAGLSIEDLGAILGVLANNGIRASTQGTAVRQVLSALLEPARKARDVFERLNISLEDIDPRTNDIVDVFERLRLAGFGTAEAFESFDKRAGSAISLLIRQSSAIERMRDKITGTNAAYEAMIARQESLKAQLTKLGNGLREFAILMSEGFIEPLKSGIGILQTFINLLKDDGVAGLLARGTLFGGAGSALFAGIFGFDRLANTIENVKSNYAALNLVMQHGRGPQAFKNVIDAINVKSDELLVKLVDWKQGNKAIDVQMIHTGLIATQFQTKMAEALKPVIEGAKGTAQLKGGLNALKIAFLSFFGVSTAMLPWIAAATAVGAAIYGWFAIAGSARRRLQEYGQEWTSTTNKHLEAVTAFQLYQDALMEATPGTKQFQFALVDLRNASAELVKVFPELAKNIDKVTGAVSVPAADLLQKNVIEPVVAEIDRLRAEIDARSRELNATGFGTLGDLPQRLEFQERHLESILKENQYLEKTNELQKEIARTAQYESKAIGQAKINDELEKQIQLLLQQAKLSAGANEGQLKTLEASLRQEGTVSSIEKLREAFKDLIQYRPELKNLFEGLFKQAATHITGLNRALEQGSNARDAALSKIQEHATGIADAFEKIDEKRIEAKAKAVAKELDSKRGGKVIDDDVQEAELVEKQIARRRLDVLDQTLITYRENFISGLKGIEKEEKEALREAIAEAVRVGEKGGKTAAKKMRKVLGDLIKDLPPEFLTFLELFASNRAKARDTSRKGIRGAGETAGLGGDGKSTENALKQAQGDFARAQAEYDADRLREINKLVEAEQRVLQGEIERIEATSKSEQEKTVEIEAARLRSILRIERAERDQIKNIADLRQAQLDLEVRSLEARIKLADRLRQLEVERVKRGRKPGSISEAERNAEIERIDGELAINAAQVESSKEKIAGYEAQIRAHEEQRKKNGIELLRQEEITLQNLREQALLEQRTAQDNITILKEERDLVRNVGETAIEMGELISSSIADGFEGIILRTSKLSELFENFGLSVLRTFSQAFAKALIEKLKFDVAFTLNMEGLANNSQSIFGRAFSAIFGNAASLAGQFFGLFGRLLGGVSGAGTASGGSGFSGFFGNLVGNVTGSSFLGGLATKGLGSLGSFIGGGTTGSPLTNFGGPLLRGITKLPFFGGIFKAGGSIIKPLFGDLLSNFVRGAGLGGLFGSGITTAPNFVSPTAFFPGEGIAKSIVDAAINPPTNFVETGAAGTEGAGGALGSGLTALLSIASLIYTFTKSAKQFSEASEVALGQRGSRDALRGLNVGGLLVGTGVGAGVGLLTGGPIGALAGAAIGAAISHAITSTIQGAVGKGVANAVRGGLTQSGLNREVLHSDSINILAAGTGKQNQEQAALIDLALGNIIGFVVRKLVNSSIPDIDVFFEDAFRDLLERGSGIQFNRNAKTPRSGLGSRGRARFDEISGNEQLDGDIRSTAQFLSLIIGSGAQNEGRLYRFINILKNGFAQTDLSLVNIEKSLFRIIRHATNDRLFQAMRVLHDLGRVLGLGARGRITDLLGRAFERTLPGVDGPTLAQDITDSGILDASRKGLKSSRKAVQESLEGFLEADFDEAFGAMGEQIGESLVASLQKSVTKAILRTPLGNAFATLFDDINKEVRKALRKGLTDQEAADIQELLLQDVELAAKLVTDMKGTLQFMNEEFRKFQQILEEAFLSDEERQRQRVDLITGLLEQIGGLFQKMLGLIIDASKAEARLIQKRSDLANITEEDKPVAVAAVEALREGVNDAFSYIQTNLGTMTTDQQLAALSTFEGAVDEFVSTAIRSVEEQFQEAIALAKQAKELYESVRKTILGTQLQDPRATAQDRLGAIQKEIERQQEIMLTGEPEEQLKAAQELQNLFPQLLQVAGEQLDQAGPHFAAVRASVQEGLNSLASFLENNAEKLTPLEEERNALLKQIAASADTMYAWIQDTQGPLYKLQIDNTTKTIRAITDLILGPGGKYTDLYDVITNATLSQLTEWEKAVKGILAAAGVDFPENPDGPGGTVGDRLPASNDTDNIQRRLRNRLSTAYDVSPARIREMQFPSDIVVQILQQAWDAAASAFSDPEQKSLLDYLRLFFDEEWLNLGPTVSFRNLANILALARDNIMQLWDTDLFKGPEITRLWDDVRAGFLTGLANNEGLKELAQLSEGGFIPRDMLALLHGQEAVVPLNSRGMQGFLAAMTQALNGSQGHLARMVSSINGGGSMEVNVNISPGAFVVNAQGADPELIKQLPGMFVERIEKEMRIGRLNKTIKDVTRRSA